MYGVDLELHNIDRMVNQVVKLVDQCQILTIDTHFHDIQKLSRFGFAERKLYNFLRRLPSS